MKLPVYACCFLVLLTLFALSACDPSGCTEVTALNYDERAKDDDGSCIFDSGETLTVNLSSCTTPNRAPQSSDADITELRRIAIIFLNSLEQSTVNDISYCLDDAELYSWSHTAAPRTGGVQFAVLSTPQRILAYDVLDAFLSDQGFHKMEFITVPIEEFLGNADPAQHGLDYTTLAFFGNPETDGSWAVQLDGHHCAMTFMVHGGLVSMAPSFLGANPAVHNGEMPLEHELSLGTGFYASLTASQQSEAYVSNLVAEDVMVGSGDATTADDNRNFDYSVFDNVGLSLNGLTAPQTAEMLTLIREYVDNLDSKFTGELIANIQNSLDTGFFTYSDESYHVYYRIYIPEVLLIEYVDPNGVPAATSTDHQHTLFRLLGSNAYSDFGVFAKTAD